MIFGGTATVERYKGNPALSVHGPGFSKILLGDDIVDEWEKYLDVMVERVLINSGRGCINCSGIWASRHAKEIAEAIGRARVGPIEPQPPEDPTAASGGLHRRRPGRRRVAKYRSRFARSGRGTHDRQVRRASDEAERYEYLRPTVAFTANPPLPRRQKEFMFAFDRRRSARRRN